VRAPLPYLGRVISILEASFAMPLYEYACQACDHKFETLVRGGDLPECPSCHGTHLEKKQSTFAGRISSGSPLTEIPTAGGCGHCGDPRGPGSCSMN
jgi:putative FmdB family regulatory protein